MNECAICVCVCGCNYDLEGYAPSEEVCGACLNVCEEEGSACGACGEWNNGKHNCSEEVEA